MSDMAACAAVVLMVFGIGCRAESDSAIGFTRADTSQQIAQPKQPVKSQRGSTSQQVGSVWIAIDYSRPVARGRALFGSLVPYDQPWNPGANRATRIQVTGDVEVDGKRLAGNNYSIWMIPRTDEWTVIFSTVANSDHQPYPGPATDALRVNVTPQRGAHLETLTFYFPVVDGNRAELRMHWGEIFVPIRIEVIAPQQPK